jgi:Cof subfamily protein (haloacid dehalogenase superfamily)
LKNIGTINLVAIDLDGTLYDSKSRISEANRKAIYKCLDNNVKVIITTAKTVYTVRNLITELGLKDPQIASAGSAIIGSNLEIIYTRKIPVQPYIKAIKLARKYKVGICTSCINGNVYVEDNDPSLNDIWESGEIPTMCESLLESQITNNALLITFAVHAKNSFNEEVENLLGSEIKLRRAGQNWLTAYSLFAGKMGALKKILSMTGIKKKNVLALGDSESDVGMLSLAGIGVAMGNAADKLKEAADYIVSDNDSDGVAEAIERFVFNNRNQASF